MRRPPSRLRLVVAAADAGASLLRFVTQRGGVAAELARASILRGGAFVDRRRERDPDAAVREGERVEVDLRGPASAAAPRLLHLDALVIAVDKPAGVLAQQGRAGGPALPDLCAQLLRERGEPGVALLVHRLDRETTGVTVLARTKAAQAALLAEFRAGRVHKEYRALCVGVPPADRGLIDLSLGADPRAPGRRRPDPRGEVARTRWEVAQKLRGAALIAAFPETGRTHQVRAHLAAIGLPLAGDVRYGGPRSLTLPDGRRMDLGRPLLHALALRLRHPAGQELSLSAPAPPDLLQAADFLAD